MRRAVITDFSCKYLQHVNYSQYTFDEINRKKYYSRKYDCFRDSEF